MSAFSGSSLPHAAWARWSPALRVAGRILSAGARLAACQLLLLAILLFGAGILDF
jgi:hypothetical protein